MSGLSLGLGYGLGLTGKSSGGSVQYAVRSVPSTADKFYIVARNNVGSADAIRFERNTGGTASASNVGVKWLEWRVTGRYRLASFDSDPTSPALTFANDVGAQDIVASNSGQKFFGSYHGLGTSGTLNSETLKIDGVTLDPTQAVSGNTFELQNSTTATDGTSTFTRDLSTTINANGGVHYKINSISVTSISFLYVGMAIATGTSYQEADVKLSSSFNVVPLGSADSRAFMPGVTIARLRDLTGGKQVTLSGNMPAVSGFSRCEIIRETSLSRSKIYLARFTSAASLANVEWDSDIAVGVTGAQFAASQILADTDFTSTPWVFAPVAARNSASGGILTQAIGVANEQLKVHCPIPGSTIGNLYMMVVDINTLQGGVAYGATSNSNSSTSSPAPAFLQNVVLGRNIQIYTATQNAPEQRFMCFVQSATLNDGATYQHPGVYAVAA